MQNGQIFKDMSIQDFCRLPVEQIQNMGLRCRNLSEIKINTNGKKISEHTLELKDIHAAEKSSQLPVRMEQGKRHWHARYVD